MCAGTQGPWMMGNLPSLIALADQIQSPASALRLFIASSRASVVRVTVTVKCTTASSSPRPTRSSVIL